MYQNLQQNQAPLQQKPTSTTYIYRFERRHSIDDIRIIMQHLSDKQRALYYMLLHYAKRYRTVFPSYARLMKETGFSKTTIIRYIEIMEALGLVTVYKRKSNNKRKDLPNIYVLPPVVLCKKFSAMIFNFCRYAYYMTIRDALYFSKDALVRMWTLYKNYIRGSYLTRFSLYTFESLSSEVGQSMEGFLVGSASSDFAFGGNAPLSLPYPAMNPCAIAPGQGGIDFGLGFVNKSKYEEIKEQEPKKLKGERLEPTDKAQSKYLQAAIEALQIGCSKVRAVYAELNRLTPGRYNSQDIQQRVNQYLAPYLKDCDEEDLQELLRMGLV